MPKSVENSYLSVNKAVIRWMSIKVAWLRWHRNFGKTSSKLSGHTFPFIARQTRAYLNFEVKDLRRPEAARLWRVLEFKVQIRFSAAMR